MPETRIAGLILAAGEGRRFGALKQVARLAGRPLLEHAIEAMVEAQVGRVIVVLGAGAERILRDVDLQGAEYVLCQHWREGMAASLRCGASRLATESAVVVTLGDQPGVSSAAIREVLSRRSGIATRATYQSWPSHPVVLERALFPRLLSLSGEHGAGELIASVGFREVPCDHLADGRDIDTPADLDAMQRVHG